MYFSAQSSGMGLYSTVRDERSMWATRPAYPPSAMVRLLGHDPVLKGPNSSRDYSPSVAGIPQPNLVFTQSRPTRAANGGACRRPFDAGARFTSLTPHRLTLRSAWLHHSILEQAERASPW